MPLNTTARKVSRYECVTPTSAIPVAPTTGPTASSQPLELALAPAHQAELRADVIERLVEKAALLVHVLRLLDLPADLRARGLGGNELAQLVEAQVEQVAQAHELLKPLHVCLHVESP